MTETRRPGCFEVDQAASAQYGFDLGGIQFAVFKSGAELFPFCRGNRGTPFRNKLIDALLKAMVLHEADFIRSQLSQSFSAIHQQKQRTV